MIATRGAYYQLEIVVARLKRSFPLFFDVNVSLSLSHSFNSFLQISSLMVLRYCMGLRLLVCIMSISMLAAGQKIRMGCASCYRAAGGHYVHDGGRYSHAFDGPWSILFFQFHVWVWNFFFASFSLILDGCWGQSIVMLSVHTFFTIGRRFFFPFLFPLLFFPYCVCCYLFQCLLTGTRI